MSTTEWADAIQAAGVIAALLFAGYELHIHTREQRYKNYLDAMSGFAAAQVLMIQTPALHALYEANAKDITAEYAELSLDQKTRVHYCDTLLGLCETVWTAHRMGWIDKSEWPDWERWLMHLHQSPEFRWTLAWVAPQYDEDFVRQIRETAARSRA